MENAQVVAALSALAQETRLGIFRLMIQTGNVIYTCNVDGIRQLLQFLTQDCCCGKPELCGDLSPSALASAAAG
jgi:hypothetical protein